MLESDAATAGTVDGTAQATADGAPTDLAGREPTGATAATGRYRLRDGVFQRDGLLVSLRPLAVTRPNDLGSRIVATLSTDRYRSPHDIGRELGVETAEVARFLDSLADRGFLEWRPVRNPSSTPPVSVVVTVRNQPDHLRACLDALVGLDYPSYEVVVVDDASTDRTADVARDHALADRGDLGLVSVGAGSELNGAGSEPLGIGASRNAGVMAADHDVIAFTDADCRPRADWLRALVPCLGAHDVVGGRTRPADSGGLQGYERAHSSLDMGPRADRVRPGDATPYLPTANLVGRRRVFEAVGFPERDVAEDVDFCWRALEAGYDVVYEPDGVVEHDYGSSPRRFVSRRVSYGASEGLLAARYGSPGSVPFPVLPMVALAAIAVGILGGNDALSLGAGGVLATIGLVGIGRSVLTNARLADAVTPRALLASRARAVLSTAYGVARETTRYYSGPLALAAAGCWLLGREPVAVAVAGAVAVAVALPAVVDYRVLAPDLRRREYVGWYLADHLAYQCGVYCGALRHRTTAHLDPSGRFSPAGPVVTAVVSRLK